MTNLRIPHAPHSLILKAVIICDDFAFAAKASATLRRVGYQAGVNGQWKIKCWPLNALHDTALAEKALSETLDAHLIVFPTRCAQSLPSWVVGWLERWARQRKTEAAALGVIDDGTATNLVKGLSPELSRLIRQYHLNLIIDDSFASKEATKLFVPFSREREVPVAVVQSHFADHATQAYRSFGINE